MSIGSKSDQIGYSAKTAPLVFGKEMKYIPLIGRRAFDVQFEHPLPTKILKYPLGLINLTLGNLFRALANFFILINNNACIKNTLPPVSDLQDPEKKPDKVQEKGLTKEQATPLEEQPVEIVQ